MSNDTPAPADPPSSLLMTGFGELPCLMCGAESAQITLSLEDGETLRCSECENEYQLEDVKTRVESIQDKWVPLIAWIETIPSLR